MEGLYPVLITWYFDPTSGDIKLDCFLELDDPKHAKVVKLIYVRAKFTNVTPALLHIPEGYGREIVEEYINNTNIREEVIKKLNSAKVRIDDIVRRKLGHNLKDFLRD